MKLRSLQCYFTNNSKGNSFMDFKLKMFCFLTMVLCLWCGYAHAESLADKPGMGSIRGRVVSDENEILPGATIFIEELNTGVISDTNGFYTIGNFKPGTYSLLIKYIGYSTVKSKIKVSRDKTVEKVFKLTADLELPEVLVNGAFQGQRKALSMQQNAMGISNVVSADQVGKFLDSNIGDALKRLNGVNVQYDQGEARFGQVRGTSADLTSVTINGNRVPSAEGDTRNVQLDLIPF